MAWKSRKHYQYTSLLNSDDEDCKTYNDPKVKEIHMIDKLICGYLYEMIPDRNLVASEIETICKDYFGIFGIDGDLIVNEHTTHKLDKKSLYQFSSITIKKGATLTVKESEQALDIICYTDIIIEEGGKINVDGMGYAGGQMYEAGSSYSTGCCMWCGCPNYGGGAGGTRFKCGGGGGYGGYGTAVDSGCLGICCPSYCLSLSSLFCYDCNFYYGWGGCKYGDKKLSVLYFGSGGGGGSTYRDNTGGSGGGALRLQCFGTIRLDKNAEISANGQDGNGYYGGGGSGGSIHLIVNDTRNIEMDSLSVISSVGGKCDDGKSEGGHGGVGRIRIQFIVNNKDDIAEFDANNKDKIRPPAFIG